MMLYVCNMSAVLLHSGDWFSAFSTLYIYIRLAGDLMVPCRKKSRVTSSDQPATSRELQLRSLLLWTEIPAAPSPSRSASFRCFSGGVGVVECKGRNGYTDLHRTLAPAVATSRSVFVAFAPADRATT